MSKETLNSFCHFSHSLLSYLISSSPKQVLTFNPEIDEISKIAFASIQLQFYCHKEYTLSSNPFHDIQETLETRELTDGVLKPICDSLEMIIKNRDSYDLKDVSLLLVGIKRGLCILKKASNDQLDNEELALSIFATLLIKEYEQGESNDVPFHLLSFLLDAQYSKKLIDSRNSLYQAVFQFLTAVCDDKDQWPTKLIRQTKGISEQVADFPTVEQALNLIIDEKDEQCSRTCRIYLLNANCTGDIKDRKFFTVSGEITEQDEDETNISIEIEKFDALK